MNHPRIDRKEITFLWHSDYYDGPLSGVCLYQGHKCWFHLKEEDEGGNRTFTVHHMSDADLKEEEYWHDLFRQHVGTHTDYIEGKRNYEVKPQSEWDKYYEPAKQRKPTQYHNNRVIGEFVW